MVVKDVKTRWNFTHAMIKRGLILRKVIDRWVRSQTALWGLTILGDEWAKLEDLRALLEVTDSSIFRGTFSQLRLAVHKCYTPNVESKDANSSMGDSHV